MFDFLYSPRGRISRKGYLLGYFLPYVAISLVLSLLAAVPLMGVLSTLVSLFYLWPSLVAVPLRRMHDTGRSGWWHALVVVLAFVLVVLATTRFFGPMMEDPEAFAGRMDGLSDEEQAAFFWSTVWSDPGARLFLMGAAALQLGEFFYFVIMPGQKGRNRFGPDPLAGGRGFAD